MKKKRILNALMVAAAILLLVGGVLAARYIRGGFEQADGTAAVLENIRGVVRLERDGVSFQPEQSTVLRAGDRITCDGAATARITLPGASLTLGNRAEVTVEDPSAQALHVNAAAGEIFAELDGAAVYVDLSGEQQVKLEQTVALISVRTGTQSISVLEGTVEQTQAGGILEWINGERNTRDLAIQALNDFTIECMRASQKQGKKLCFSSEELDALAQSRREEGTPSRPTQQSTEPAESTGETEPAQTEEPTQPAETKPGETKPSETKPTETKPGETKPSETKPAETKPAETKPSETKPAETKPGETKPSETKPSETKPAETKPTETKPAPTEPTETEPTDGGGELHCTLSIRCDTILNNMDKLKPAKADYVPQDGWILYAEVEFTQGETVFDVLKRACSRYGIQLEYSWTPMYNSYYIEGIHNLYEFDCGPESGWMYKVNGWFPNYGCSAYTLEDGDNIVWCYTCVGLGADVGGGW